MRWVTIVALAVRNLVPARRGHRLGGAILGMGLSLVPLLVVVVVTNGMIEGITERLLEIGTYHLQLIPAATGPDADALAELVAAMPSVRIAFAERQGIGLLYSPHGRTGIQVRAIPPEIPLTDEGLRRYLTVREGAFDLDGERGIVVGEAVARDLALSVGAEVKLLTARYTRGRFLPRISRFVVAGVYASGYQDIDRSWVYIALAEGRRILPADSAREVVAVKVADPFRGLDQVVAEIRRGLADRGGNPRITTWFELEENQYRSFQTTRAVLVFIMVLIVLVAAVNVSSSLVMMVLESQRDIGILKAMGAGPWDVSRVYLTTGFLTGVAGCTLGIPLGLAVAVSVNEVIRALELTANAALSAVAVLLRRPAAPVSLLNPAFYLESIPVRLSIFEAAAAAALAIFLSVVAAWLPARRAGRIQPAEVLRRH